MFHDGLQTVDLHRIIKTGRRSWEFIRPSAREYHHAAIGIVSGVGALLCVIIPICFSLFGVGR